MFRNLLSTLTPLLLGAVLAGCSPKHNTAGSRRWQAFVTRYNVHYNATVAYRNGELAQRNGVREDFTAPLPLFTVGYAQMRSLGKSDFATAVTKCEKAISLHSIKAKPRRTVGRTPSPRTRAFLARGEFNPFLKNSWLLMGRAQFQQGDFTAAASTFAYITRFYAAEPAVVAEARIWLARCYAQLDWFYDAEEALRPLNGQNLTRRLEGERALTDALLLLRSHRAAEALPHLNRALRHVPGGMPRARLAYRLAQTHIALGQKAEADRALRQCLANSSDRTMTFHARILRTEVLADARNAPKMMRRLRRMAADPANADFLDQVYYALGNLHLAGRDTLSALNAYETGRARATQSTPEKGVLLRRLADLYWTRRRFDKAQPCYTEALGLLDKTREDYAELLRRSRVLDALVPHTTTVFEQDSLLALAALPEAERNAVIDRAIADLRRREREAQRARADSATRARADDGPANAPHDRTPDTPTPRNAGTDRSWYFYNPQLVRQGKEDFLRRWGRRKNEDDWQRANRSILATDHGPTFDYAADEALAARQRARRDSLAATGLSPSEIERRLAQEEEPPEEGGSTAPDDPARDPHQRAYYLAQIPFTPEAQAAAQAQIREALLEAAIIEKDQLHDLSLARETLLRLVRQHPTYDRLNEAYYHLFLIARRQGHAAQADRYRQTLAQHYPTYAMTQVVCDPDFERNSRYGRELEDSLYADTYNAYRRGDRATVARNAARSAKVYPQGANRPKFLLVDALARLGTAPRDTLIQAFRTLATDYPKSDVAEMAAMIVRGLESGRTLHGTAFPLDGLWNRRIAETAAETAAAGAGRTLSDKAEQPHHLIIAYPAGALADDSLLFALARFNFSTFASRGFDLVKEGDATLHRFRVAGFASLHDVQAYARRLYRDAHLAPLLRRARVFLVSRQNLPLLGTLYSYDEYAQFFEKTFAPLDLNPDLPLEFEPLPDGQPRQIYEDELPDTAPANTSGTRNGEEDASPVKEYEDYEP